MFSSLGLFKQTPCPEYPNCSLQSCLFAHNDVTNPFGEDVPQRKSVNGRSAESDENINGIDGPRKRRRLNNEDLAQDSSQRADADTLGAPTSSTPKLDAAVPETVGPTIENAVLLKTATKSISPPPRRILKPSTTKPVAVRHDGTAKAQMDPIRHDESASKPTIKKGSASKVGRPEESLNPRMLPNPPVPHPVRVKLVAMLHEEMTRLNTEVKKDSDASIKEVLVLSSAELISEALNEECLIAKKNPAVYQNIIKSRIMVLKRMKLEVWKEERLKRIAEKLPKEASEKRSTPKIIETGLTPAEEVAFVSRLAAQQEGLSKHGYITAAASEAEIETARKGLETAQGWEQCDRCSTRFQVFPGRRAEDGALTSGGTCTYHWAKPRRPPTAKGDKPRDLTYACCDQPMGVSAGCTKADSHVFKISDPKRLALIMPFRQTPIPEGTGLPGAVCFDCEMGYTTFGMELIRLTATAWPDGREVLDVLVRPLGEVLDLNSRFSGVWPEDYAKAVPYDSGPRESGKAVDASVLKLVDSPVKARELLFELLTPDTPLMGHALENDLNASRILHSVIVDTCLLFPHPRGLPLRFGLKMLMKKYLDRDIQMGGAQGHDSKEDARAAGDLAKTKPAIRRLSSVSTTFEELTLGPSVVVPPEHMMKPSDAHETAAAMEMAKHRLKDLESGPGDLTPPSPPQTNFTDQYAFAFDIDGVLIRGGKPIPQAVEAMKVLNGQNEYGVKVPYIFVTNGGGKTEQERCLDLSRQLEMEISPGQFICGHTPMREMAQKYNTVLVVGGEGDKCRTVAEGYGFKDVVTPGDIIKDNKDTTPFRKLTQDETDHSRARNFGETEIEAIFVFADSRDWAGDQQIILDLLMSKKGRLGTRSDTFDEGPPIFFSHNDIVWSTSHNLTRIGMGALRASLEAMYKAITGKDLISTAFGKPQIGTFQFATRLLQQWRKDTHGINAPPQTVYFVGDTPESDIRGTNEFNASELSENTWYSILVRTGVFQEGTKPAFQPNATVDNVLEAVKYGIQREVDRSMKSKIQQLSEQQEAIVEE
ncbi:MAG: hypothetical protein Q9194_006089 [Teloschistes cf. exilis]